MEWHTQHLHMIACSICGTGCMVTAAVADIILYKIAKIKLEIHKTYHLILCSLKTNQ